MAVDRQTLGVTRPWASCSSTLGEKGMRLETEIAPGVGMYRGNAESLRQAAPKIQAKLRSDATTARGNVPSFGKFGDIPITATVRAGQVVVTAADWVMERAKEEGQPKAWAGILREEARKALRGAR